MGKLLKHLKTIRIHRKYVRQMCWKMGLFWQGLVHDLSKYSITELKIAKYYGAGKSPHQWCREQIGYSPSWIHHYHKNKHHWEFWIDDDENAQPIPIKMPYKYVIESFCDMVGASRAYSQKQWKEEMVWDYWEKRCKGKRIMDKESSYLLEKLIWDLKEMGLKRFLKWYKTAKKEHLKPCYEDGTLMNE